MKNRRTSDHLSVEQGATGNLPHKITKMAIGSIHHRRNAQGVTVLGNCGLSATGVRQNCWVETGHWSRVVCIGAIAQALLKIVDRIQL
jgi:hypothetical protein